MPLLPGKKNQGRNIGELIASGHSKDQAIAISYDILKRPKKDASKSRQKFIRNST